MRFEVYQPDKIEAPLTRLTLKQSGGYVLLCAVKADGEIEAGGSILTINPSGKIKMFKSVDPDLGFCLDDGGRVKIVP